MLRVLSLHLPISAHCIPPLPSCPVHLAHSSPAPPAPTRLCSAASSWKAGMGLRKQGKEGSIALACHLLPAAAPLLK